ncbi:hypothetical protein MAQA_15776 [Listeria aquatica FSL S10-1188]|uniref:Uncharacterized protein n=1 Tax=Listeria aquatica FSL S10-1188 TaxID=1265818 RepID=W7ATT3_9LIST|nr:hypothetical protein MAQA_15776 [Listeria aquatica FSL S10-1188]
MNPKTYIVFQLKVTFYGQTFQSNYLEKKEMSFFIWTVAILTTTMRLMRLITQQDGRIALHIRTYQYELKTKNI